MMLYILTKDVLDLLDLKLPVLSRKLRLEIPRFTRNKSYFFSTVESI